MYSFGKDWTILLSLVNFQHLIKPEKVKWPDPHVYLIFEIKLTCQSCEAAAFLVELRG